MGRHKTSVEGRVMWESPDGQRVSDPADIPEFRSRPSSTSMQAVFLSTFTTFLVGAFFGLIAGVIIGSFIFGATQCLTK